MPASHAMGSDLEVTVVFRHRCFVPRYRSYPMRTLDRWFIWRIDSPRTQVSITLDHELVQARSGDIFLVPANCRHALEFAGPAVRLCGCDMRCRWSDGRDLGRSYAFPVVLRGRQAHAVGRQLARVVTAGSEDDSLRSRLAQRAAALTLVSALLVHAEPRPEHPGLSRIQPIIDHLRQHLAQPVTRAGLARLLGISPQRLYELFVDSVGMGPLQYQRQLRVHRAQELLLDRQRSLADIAAELGFGDAFHLSRVFRAACGIPPSVYRRHCAP